MGIPVRVDHTVDEQVEALFARVVKEEHDRLDILVNNAWGGYERMENYDAPVWEQPIWRWDVMFDTSARASFVASRLAVPLLRLHAQQRPGLIAITGYLDHDATQCRHIASVAKLAANGLGYLLAKEVWDHNIAVLTVSPIGPIHEWVWGGEELHEVYDALRTPDGLAALHQKHPNRVGQSPEYTGRAVAMLAADPH
ncbi:MAG: SDR family oxidoreductase, partial [Chloroflexota bacterium]